MRAHARRAWVLWVHLGTLAWAKETAKNIRCGKCNGLFDVLIASELLMRWNNGFGGKRVDNVICDICNNAIASDKIVFHCKKSSSRRSVKHNGVDWDVCAHCLQFKSNSIGLNPRDSAFGFEDNVVDELSVVNERLELKSDVDYVDTLD